MGNPDKWLITGGLGYIGSHVADAFLSEGKEVIILDSGYRGPVSRLEYLERRHGKGIPLEFIDIRDFDRLKSALQRHKPNGIIHTAGLKSVSESIQNPDQYFEVNFSATRGILRAASALGINKFIFSSTAAVYGAPSHQRLVEENDIKFPISPYGESKLAAEREVMNFLRIKGHSGTCLRFFNVIGAENFELRDNSIENIVPIVMQKLVNGERPLIYGANHPTIDGTCVRDYVDVRDVARAHLLAAQTQRHLPVALNVGTGHGKSVRELIDALKSALKKDAIEPLEIGSRLGDPSFLCANVTLINDVLDFRSLFSFEESISSVLV